MIIIGYQGIGKSTLTKEGNNFIDLRSGNFRVIEGPIGPSWDVVYLNVARDLSRQGYDVLISSHKILVDNLIEDKSYTVIVCPALELKDEWIQKLKNRYYKTLSFEHLKALKDAECSYDEKISGLINHDCFDKIVLSKMSYDLVSLINDYKIAKIL